MGIGVMLRNQVPTLFLKPASSFPAPERHTNVEVPVSGVVGVDRLIANSAFTLSVTVGINMDVLMLFREMSPRMREPAHVQHGFASLTGAWGVGMGGTVFPWSDTRLDVGRRYTTPGSGFAVTLNARCLDLVCDRSTPRFSFLVTVLLGSGSLPAGGHGARARMGVSHRLLVA